MTIYRLVQVSLNNGRMTDFNLPETLGYYTTEHGALESMAQHINSFAAIDDTYVTTNDYRIEPVYVVEG